MSLRELYILLVLLSVSACAGMKEFGSQEVQRRSSGRGAEDSSLGVASDRLRGIHVTLSKTSLKIGERGEAKAFGLYADGSVRNITKYVDWSTSDKKIAKLGTMDHDAIEVHSIRGGSVDISVEISKFNEKAILLIERLILQADLNSDSRVDGSDLEILNGEMGLISSLLAADGNGDGIVDQADYLVQKSNYGNAGGPGDYNQDGSVNAADFTVWRNTVGSRAVILHADINKDGKVDQSDLDILLQELGQQS